MERRTLLALLLSFAVVMMWNQLFLPPPQDVTPVESVVEAEAPESAQVPTSADVPGNQPVIAQVPAEETTPAALNSVQAKHPLRTVDLSSHLSTYTFSSQGGGPEKVVLSDYRERIDSGGLLSWLWDGISSGFKFKPIKSETEPDLVRLLGSGSSGSSVLFSPNSGGSLVATPERLISETANSVRFESQDGPITVQKTYVLNEDGLSMVMNVSLQNSGSSHWTGQPTLFLTEELKETVGPFDVLSRIVYVDDSADFEDASGFDADEVDRMAGEIDWFGVGDNYFLSAVVLAEPQAGVVKSELVGEEHIQVSFTPETALSLGPNEVKNLSYTLYLGPKDIEVLKSYDRSLDKAIDFGFLSVFAFPLLYLLRFFYGIVGSYGAAIIALTLTMKTLTFPLTHKSMASMQRMKVIQPEIKKLQETYADNKEQLNQEMMKLMTEKKVNPLGGCLPTVIQLPIWFALYRVLQNSIELYRTPFLYLEDLSAADPYGIAPILVGALMIIQQRLTPTANVDPTQKRIMQLMPVFFSFIMFNLPSGLVVYITVNSLLSITHHGIFNKISASKTS